MNTAVNLEKLVSLCKRRGFVYQSSDIYGGLNGVYDFGHLGHLLRENIKNAWRKSVKKSQSSTLFFEGALLGSEAMWKASGHIDNFHDPMIDCTGCNKRYRADDIDTERACPHCGKRAWTEIRQFNMMFKTNVGASIETGSTAYLRPETAQAIFVNFKNVMSTNRIKIPFGIGQVGKAFRNEITPKQFLFRMREFEQMELEWFCKPESVLQWFDFWVQERKNFYQSIGIVSQHIRLRQYEKNELAHYSTCCTDIEYEFPFGWKELEGIAYRGDFDLTQHTKYSGKDLAIHDEVTKESYMPHIVESSVGVDRLFLTLLFEAYKEESVNEDQRTVLAFHPIIAPVKAAFLPLTGKLASQMKEIFERINAGYEYHIEFDETGSIGKRYRRQDEIGTPVCFTYDFDSEQNGSVTARNRDTLQQDRIAIDQIENYLRTLMQK